MYKLKFTFFTLMLGVLGVCLTACSGDDDDTSGIDTSAITAYAGDSTSIAGASSIETANEFVAYSNSGRYVKGYHVGQTTVTVNKKHTVPVTVKGKFNTYDDPIFEWGVSPSYVKSRQSQGSLSSNSTDDMLIYENAGKAYALSYNFKNGKLNSVMAIVKTTYTSELADYLLERFILLPYDKDGETYFVGCDALKVAEANTYVILQVYSSKYLVVYYTSPSSSSSAKASAAKCGASTLKLCNSIALQ